MYFKKKAVGKKRVCFVKKKKKKKWSIVTTLIKGIFYKAVGKKEGAM